jgi:hypothetical protein
MINQVQQFYSIASPSTWTFEKDGQSYGGFEEFIFSPAQKNEIISLGGQWFESAQAFQDWMSGATAIAKQQKDIAFGNSLIAEFNAAEQQTAVDASTYQAIIEVFKYALFALQMGNIVQARAQIMAISITNYAPVWDQSKRDYFISKIDNYLAQ